MVEQDKFIYSTKGSWIHFQRVLFVYPMKEPKPKRLWKMSRITSYDKNAIEYSWPWQDSNLQFPLDFDNGRLKLPV